MLVVHFSFGYNYAGLTLYLNFFFGKDQVRSMRLFQQRSRTVRCAGCLIQSPIVCPAAISNEQDFYTLANSRQLFQVSSWLCLVLHSYMHQYDCPYYALMIYTWISITSICIANYIEALCFQLLSILHVYNLTCGLLTAFTIHEKQK